MNDCTVKPCVYFPLCLFHSSICPFFHCNTSSDALFPPCLPDGAAMRAGVQTGDRIIKVSCSSASVFYQLHWFLLRVNTEATGCHLVVARCSASLCCESGRFGVRTFSFFCECSFVIAVFQVNGTLVTHSNHIEVVKLIKCEFSLPRDAF